MRDQFLDWTAGGRQGSMWQRIVDDLDALLGRFIRALLLLSLATFVAYAIFFYVAGVPYGVLLAVGAAVLEFIPVIGPLVAAIACVIVAGLSGYTHLLVLAGFIALYRLFQDYVVNPMLMSGGVAVPPCSSSSVFLPVQSSRALRESFFRCRCSRQQRSQSFASPRNATQRPSPSGPKS